MFGSNVFEIGIGLVLVYLSVSLVCTAANELIAAALRSRARLLEQGIWNLLDGTTRVPISFWDRFRSIVSPPAANQTEIWASEFFNHQLINALSKDGEIPSYIPSRTFAMVLINLVARAAKAPLAPTLPSPAGINAAAAANVIPAAPPLSQPLHGQCTFDDIHATLMALQGNPRLRDALLTLLEQARTDLTDRITAIRKFSNEIEVWFDHSMDRVSGWYKRRATAVVAILALVSCVLMNVDSLTICRTLGRDDTLRASMVAIATKAVAAPQNSPEPATEPTNTPGFETSFQQLHDSVTGVQNLGIPLGWTDWTAAHHSAAAGSPPSPYLPRDDNVYDVFHSPSILSRKLLGLLITALAASLGAPFWFDVLNKFISIRSAGKAPEEKPKDPKKVLQPQSPNDNK